MNESGPAICGRSARPHHRKMICDEDLVTEDATVLTVLWIHARVVTYAVSKQRSLIVFVYFYFNFFGPTSRFGSKAFGEDFVGAWFGRGNNFSSMGVLAPASESVSQPGGAFEWLYHYLSIPYFIFDTQREAFKPCVRS